MILQKGCAASQRMHEQRQGSCVTGEVRSQQAQWVQHCMLPLLCLFVTAATHLLLSLLLLLSVCYCIQSIAFVTAVLLLLLLICYSC